MKYGHWKYNRLRYVDGVWIFGAIEKESKKLRLEIIPNKCRNQDNMRSLIEKYIEPGSIICSDSAKFYKNIGDWGYTHKTVNHSVEFVAEDGTNTLSCISIRTLF